MSLISSGRLSGSVKRLVQKSFISATEGDRANFGSLTTSSCDRTPLDTPAAGHLVAGIFDRLSRDSVHCTWVLLVDVANFDKAVGSLCGCWLAGVLIYSKLDLTIDSSQSASHSPALSTASVTCAWRGWGSLTESRRENQLCLMSNSKYTIMILAEHSDLLKEVGNRRFETSSPSKGSTANEKRRARRPFQRRQSDNGSCDVVPCRAGRNAEIQCMATW